MSQTQEFSRFTIVRQTKQQLNIAAPCLYRDKERATILKILLLKREAIESVEVDSEKDLVTIRFDRVKLPKEELLKSLDCVLENFSQKPREKIKKTGRQCAKCGGLEREIFFYVEGMSCASCALYLEMILSRNEKVSKAKIDYSSKKGVIVGCLSRGDVLDIVEKLGYKAKVLDGD